MKHKIFDVIIGKKLSTIVPNYVVIMRTRLSSQEAIELDKNKFLLIIINALKKSNILNLDSLPSQIAESIKRLISKEISTVTIKDVETLLIIMRYYNYDMFVVGRMDIEEIPNDDDNISTYSYLLDNYSNNNIGSSAFYIGYSRNYTEDVVPIAYDYIDLFGLSKEEIDYLELDISNKAYDILSSQGEMSKFDDTRSMELINSSGCKFVVFNVL